MRFDRFPKGTQIEATPRRVAAAKRAVEADRERCGLFPDMMRFKTAEERVTQIIEGGAKWWQEMRDHKAHSWRKERRRLNLLPPLTRAGLMKYWSVCSLPGDPAYLGCLITEALRGVCFWHKLAERRRLKLIGAGKMEAPWKKRF